MNMYPPTVAPETDESVNFTHVKFLRLNDGERDELFTQFRPLVQRLLRKYADTPERRHDLEGEIFCLFCELLQAFDPKRGVPLKAYLVHQLTAATYTEARKHWRNQKREISLELYEEIPTKEDPTKKWDDSILLDEVCALLPASIARLPTRQRQVVLWRYYEHLSFDEIAGRLSVQPATVRSLLRHGLTALRRIFQQSDIQL